MLKPETAIDSWRKWDIRLSTRPTPAGALGGGRSNSSYLLASGERRMVLRINGPDTALPGRDRTCEGRIWQAARAAGISPRLLYADPGGAFLVSAFVENQLTGRPQDVAHLADKALQLLQRCHQLDVDAPVIDYSAHIDRYWQLIDDHGISFDPALAAQRRPMDAVLERLCSAGAEKGLCHHDPVAENFVGSPEKLYLIDWEYAARGSVVMDYAAFAVEWSIETALICDRTGIETEFLTTAMDFYRYQCRLWEAITQASHCS